MKDSTQERHKEVLFADRRMERRRGAKKYMIKRFPLRLPTYRDVLVPREAGCRERLCVEFLI